MKYRMVGPCVLLLALCVQSSLHAQEEVSLQAEPQQTASLVSVAHQEPVPKEPSIHPEYVRALFGMGAAGSNDSSPSWALSGSLLAFERAEESKREIVIAHADGTIVKNVYYQTDEDDLGLGALLPGLGVSVSYNSGIAWSGNDDQFVFMSNAGEGNYDLYLGTMESKSVLRLTSDPQKDGQPSWSPTGGQVVFVSGRNGGAQLFLMDVASRRTDRISPGVKSYLYPRWSPDGKRIAAIYGDNENHDIVVLDGLPATSDKAMVAAPKERTLTTWQYDDLSPSWSPDGKHIAFYSNYNAEGDPKIWSLLVVDTDGSSPTEGERLVARVVAYNVLPDVSSGPAWFPDSARIAYVRNDKQDYSPIYVVDVNTHKGARLETGTSINHDLAVSSAGVIAFRAQVDQWDQVFLAKLPEAVQ